MPATIRPSWHAVSFPAPSCRTLPIRSRGVALVAPVAELFLLDPAPGLLRLQTEHGDVAVVQDSEGGL